MVEVSRPDGVMVFRPWTVSRKLRGEDYHRMSSNWTDETNANYCTAVAELAEAIKVAFPARVDTSKIGNCCQTREESVQDYYHRLYETFNKHSGLDEPDDRGNQPGTWECHLRSWFLNGLRPEIAQAVKGNYIEWKNGRLTAVLAHALHAEEQQATKKERARAKTDKDLQLALVQAVSRPGGYSAPQNQQMRGGRGKGRGGRPSSWTERNPKQRGCVICGTDDHLTRECSKCRLCKKDGHWSRECPENQQNQAGD
ncbi:hypothetical protein H4Q32_030105 [Labeo rohita]|uniref:CCHC-type domain-containing protein n=1 Tax=Labeo rohita TaxID=84645 RepID=A0ABQ8MGT1_LABRO|nr:hypothetical protein H4Q32_030105 [Labeo rohita]